MSVVENSGKNVHRRFSFPFLSVFPFVLSFRRTNPSNPDTQPTPSRLGTRNMTARSTFHSGQTRPRAQNGPGQYDDPTSPGVGGRPSIFSKLTSRFSKR